MLRPLLDHLIRAREQRDRQIGADVFTACFCDLGADLCVKTTLAPLPWRLDRRWRSQPMANDTGSVEPDCSCSQTVAMNANRTSSRFWTPEKALAHLENIEILEFDPRAWLAIVINIVATDGRI